ncbi:hypothetical protein [Xanthomonas arboricola]|uniref:Fe-S cluster biosynthesis and repair protein YggX n=1 Tax=Xanthomonas arboricola TaxID=56448 RepID=A0AB73H2Z4_9XANT|nr:hypothetical protein [Xanthomonas arboricola]MBB5672343.1 Fe-S cluster biosynthesis and repair protein YggX [Xanthomonas arboricola]
MNDQLQPVGASDPSFQHYPMGFRTLFQEIWKEQWKLWTAAGCPKPAPNALMNTIDRVMWNAWKSDLGILLKAHNQYLQAEMVTVVSSYQHSHGMITTADLIPTL